MFKEIRIKKGYTQQEIAELLNLSVKTVYLIDKTNNTSIIIARKIAKLFEITIDEIFKEDKHK